MKNEKIEKHYSSIKGYQPPLEGALLSLLGEWLKKLGYLSWLVTVPSLAASELQQTRKGGSTEVKVIGDRVLPDRVKRIGLANTAALDERDACPGLSIPGGTYTSNSPFTVSGDTTSSSNKVDWVCGPYCYSYFDTPGADHIYSFKASAIDSGAFIEVISNSPGYSPVIYYLDTYAGAACPTAADNYVWQPNWGPDDRLGLWSDLANRKIYIFVDSVSGGANGAGSYTLRMTGVTVAPIPSISGKITTPDGRGLRNAIVSLTDSSGTRRTVLTSSLGYYTFTNLVAGLAYNIGVSSKRYRFESKTVSTTDNLTNFDFVGFE